MKRGSFGILVLASVLLQAAGPAVAERQGQRFPDRQGGEARPMPQAPAGEQERGREASSPGQGAPVRMSPDQRRQLRRDIGAHGREIYGERRPPR